MLKKISKLGIILFIILCGSFSLSAFAEELMPLGLVKKAASNHIYQIWGEVQLKEPVLYYHTDGTPAVYVFTVYKGKGGVPTDTTILNKIKYLRNMALEGKIAKNKSYWKKLRGEEEFATVVVGASKEHMPVLMYYDGLPLHYVSLDKTKLKASEALKTDSVKLNRYIWEDFYAVFFEFSDTKGGSVMVNAYSGEVFPVEDFKAKFIVEIERFKKSDVYKQKLERCKKAWQDVSETDSSTRQSIYFVERKITGVPDYQQDHFGIGDNDCAPTAAACVLAYWDDHVNDSDLYVFERFVDYGDSDWDTNPAGVSTLVSELKAAMGWGRIDGTLIKDITPGILAVSNSPAYGNNYTFTSDTWPLPPEEEDEPPPPPPSFDYVKGEIDSKHPEVFSIGHPLYGYHPIRSPGKHSVAVVGYTISLGVNYIIVHDNWDTTEEDVSLQMNEIAEGYLTRIIPNTEEPPNINCAQAAIAHHYNYVTFEEDVVLNEPLLMEETWKWWVGNLVDTGEVISNVKFTANCPPSVVWTMGEPPSYANPPTYIWDYGVDIPEDMFYNVGGHVEPGAQILSPVRITRQVVPEILEEPETIQTVTAQVIFTSLPSQDANVGIGIPQDVLYTPLIETEIISQNDLPDWNEGISSGVAGWYIPHDKIDLNVPYTFIAEVRSVKSPQIIETLVLWKPKVGVDMGNWVFITPPAVGPSCRLFHPEEGVDVAFETADDTGWIAFLNAGGIELAMERVIQIAPTLDAIGDKTVNEGDTLTFTVNATDLDNDPLTYSASNLPAGANFDPGSRTFSWTPDFDQAGTYQNVHFEVSDGTWTDSEDITITVNNVNRPPVLNPIRNKSVNEGALLQFNLSARDPDGDTLTYSMINAPAGATINPQTGQFSWRPTYTQADSYIVTFVASDGDLSDDETITITVNNVPCPDLAIGAITYKPSNPRPGKAVKFKAPISNIGDGTAGRFVVTFEIDGVIKDRIRQERLKPGKTTTLTFKWKAQRGAHNVRIIADANNQIQEQSENNNIAETQITVP